MADQPQVTLSNMASGAAELLFHQEFQRCLENIRDVNTDAEAKRVITMKFTLVPDEKRQYVDLEIAASSKMPAVKPAETRVHIFRTSAGQNIAKEQVRPQMSVPGTAIDPVPAPNPTMQ